MDRVGGPPAKKPRRLTLREAGVLFGVCVAGGLALALAGAGIVRPASAEDVDIFGVFRRDFGRPDVQVAPRYDPYPAAQVRHAERHRRNSRDARQEHRQERRLAARSDTPVAKRPAVRPVAKAAVASPQRPRPIAPVRYSYAALPVPAKPSASPDLSGTVDTAFLAGETKALRQAAAGQGAYGWLLGRQTMCVRLCDGYAFPVGNLANLRDLPLHETACSSSCPGAATALFTLAPGQTELSEARALSGRTYGALRTAFAFSHKRVPACSCSGDGTVAMQPFPISRDRTLRAGDIVVGNSAAYVMHGGRTLQFLSLRQDRSLSPAMRRQLELAFGGPRPRVRVKLSSAQAGPPANGRATEAGTVDSAGKVRVVMPSPF